jgi:hypothetical protein
VDCSALSAAGRFAVLEMVNHETNILSRANEELEQFFERMRRNCERALEIIQDTEKDDLSSKSCEQLYGRIHVLCEMLAILSPGFEKKLMVETEKLGPGVSPDDVRFLLYGVRFERLCRMPNPKTQTGAQ